MMKHLTGPLVIIAWGLMMEAGATQRFEEAHGLTTVPGIKVGHYTLSERLTGCTVVLAENVAVAGVDVRGAAPGTRETDLLDPKNTVQKVHAIVQSGGSAFGLNTAAGVMRYLEERNIGFETRVARIPIVPAAILYDLSVGENPRIRPTGECGYRAALTASTGPVAQGNVGAGAGATIGKLRGQDRAMKAGIGSISLRHSNGLIVAALVAVNSIGDIIDPSTGNVVAGVRTPDGRKLADARLLLRSGTSGEAQPLENTTSGVVATNAHLTKVQVSQMAQMAHDGYARAITPVHTPHDGDTIFSLATGTWSGSVDMLTIGALAADAVADSIVRSARMATGIQDRNQ